MKFIPLLTTTILAASGFLFAADTPIEQIGQNAVRITPDSLRELNSRVEEARFGEDGPSVIVPSGSILEDNGKTHVFLQSEDDPERFDLVEVTPGKPAEDGIEILTGLFPGDRIIVRNSVPPLREAPPAVVASAPRVFSRTDDPRPPVNTPSPLDAPLPAEPRVSLRTEEPRPLVPAPSSLAPKAEAEVLTNFERYHCPFEQAAFLRNEWRSEYHSRRESRFLESCPFERSTREFRHGFDHPVPSHSSP